MVSRSNQRVVSSLLARKLDRKTPKYRKKLLPSDKSTSFASDKSCHCAFTSPLLDSSCFKLHFYVVEYDPFLRCFLFRFKWQQPFPDLFDCNEDFFSELFFWITVWRSSKEQFNVFGTKSNLKGSPLTSKGTNGYFGQGVWN